MNKVKNFFQFFSDHAIYSKLLVLIIFLSCWLILVLGAIFSPNKQIYTDQQLATEQIFSNGSGTINLESQVYSKDSKQLLLSFETEDTTSSIKGLPINPENLEWEVYSKNKTDIELQLFPVIDNKIVAIINNLDSNFDVLAVYVKNNKQRTDEIQTDIKSSKEDLISEDIEQKKANTNEIYFYVLSDSDNLKVQNMKNMNPKDFAINSVNQEIEYQKVQIKKVKNSIKTLNTNIKDIQNSIKKLESENQYLSDSEKETNESNIVELENEIESKETLITESKESINEANGKIELLNSKIKDLNNGDLKLPKPIKGK